jgi:hypothetical protein
MAKNSAANAAASRTNTATPVPDPAAGFQGPRAPSKSPSTSSSEALALVSASKASPSTPKVPSTTPTVPPASQVSQTPNSLFADPAPSDMNSEPAATPSPDLKRKVTDPNLKIITIDPIYDLTLIVGSPGGPEEQTAFQVNKGTLRHASEVWNKSLTGPWGARHKNQSEIEFLDDSPWAFEQVLRIVHWQISKLPLKLTITELKSLATLTDKYDLGSPMKMALDSSRWLHPVRYDTWRQWPAQSSLREWTFITHALQSQHDYEYLLSRLAVEVQVDATDVSFYYVTREGKTKLGDLPDRILGKCDQISVFVLSS